MYQTCKQMGLQAPDAKNNTINIMKQLKSYEIIRTHVNPGRLSQTCKQLGLQTHHAKSNQGNNMKSLESYEII